MTRNQVLSICGGVAVLALAAVYYFYDPSQSTMAPRCMLNAMTGFLCPGCGSQRMLHALLHGDFIAAWHYNAFVICIFPLLGAMLFAAAFRPRFPRLYAFLNSVPMIVGISAAIVIWTIARNLA